MNEHEREFLEKLTAELKTAVVANGRRSPWSSRKMVGAVVGLISALTLAVGGLSYVGTRQSTANADADQKAANTSTAARYVLEDQFKDSQEQQDQAVDKQLTAIHGDISEIRADLKSITPVLYGISGQLKMVAKQVGAPPLGTADAP